MEKVLQIKVHYYYSVMIFFKMSLELAGYKINQ